jgi:hypothetical protein
MDGLEYEEYDDLVRSVGWARFRAYVESLWGAPGTSNGEMFRNAVASAASETADADATAKLRQIIAAQREIQRIMAHPAKRVQDLKPRELRPDEFVGSRRGGL